MERTRNLAVQGDVTLNGNSIGTSSDLQMGEKRQVGRIQTRNGYRSGPGFCVRRSSSIRGSTGFVR
jgi:hypothetical protein